MLAEPAALKYPNFAWPAHPVVTAVELCGHSVNNAEPYPWSTSIKISDSRHFKDDNKWNRFSRPDIPVNYSTSNPPTSFVWSFILSYLLLFLLSLFQRRVTPAIPPSKSTQLVDSSPHHSDCRLHHLLSPIRPIIRPQHSPQPASSPSHCLILSRLLPRCPHPRRIVSSYLYICISLAPVCITIYRTIF